MVSPLLCVCLQDYLGAAIVLTVAVTSIWCGRPAGGEVGLGLTYALLVGFPSSSVSPNPV